jgi:hypothetical protein
MNRSAYFGILRKTVQYINKTLKRREKIINIPRNIAEIRSKVHVHLLPCIEIGRLAMDKLCSGECGPPEEFLLLFRDNKKIQFL